MRTTSPRQTQKIADFLSIAGYPTSNGTDFREDMTTGSLSSVSPEPTSQPSGQMYWTYALNILLVIIGYLIYYKCLAKHCSCISRCSASPTPPDELVNQPLGSDFQSDVAPREPAKCNLTTRSDVFTSSTSSPQFAIFDPSNYSGTTTYWNMNAESAFTYSSNTVHIFDPSNYPDTTTYWNKDAESTFTYSSNTLHNYKHGFSYSIK